MWIILFIALIFVILYLIFKKRKNNKMKKIMENRPMRRFKYLDTFYYTLIQGDGEDTLHIPLYHPVLMDEETGQIYVVNKPLFKNAWFITIGNETHFKKGKVGEVNFNDSGAFWIDEELNGFYQKNDEFITLDNKQLVYSKYRSNVAISGYGDTEETVSILYNFNPNYDASLLDNAKFITAVIEFDTNA